ncbi:MAG TPA: hypothetical protein VGD41_19415, partial [Pyrinomonadaceae bacterium]
MRQGKNVPSRHSTAAALVVVLAATSAVISLRAQEPRPENFSSASPFTDWPRYGGTPENDHY